MARWLKQLYEYDFSIVHRQGRKHTNADSLSQLLCKQCGRETHMEELTAAVVTLAFTWLRNHGIIDWKETCYLPETASSAHMNSTDRESGLGFGSMVEYTKINSISCV